MKWVERNPFLQKYAKDYGPVECRPTNQDVNEWVARKFPSYKYRLSLNSMIELLGEPSAPFTFTTSKGMKLGRVFKELFPPELHPLLNQLNELSKPRIGHLILSVRKHDLLRRGHSKHFSTCVSGMGTNGWTLEYEAKWPDIAVVFLRDKHGEMLARQTVRVGYDHSPMGKLVPKGLWLHSRQYGIRVDFPSILKKLNIPISGLPLTPPGQYLDGDDDKFL